MPGLFGLGEDADKNKDAENFKDLEFGDRTWDNMLAAFKEDVAGTGESIIDAKSILDAIKDENILFAEMIDHIKRLKVKQGALLQSQSDVLNLNALSLI